MKVAVYSINLSFFGPIADALRRAGHEVLFWEEKEALENGLQIGRLNEWADIAFFEFCQTPMPIVLNCARKKNLLTVARMHRIEMYNNLTEDKNFDWSRLDITLFSAKHVTERFIEKRNGLTKPVTMITAETNIVDPEQYKYRERKWKPPFRIAMIGNFVPKKRQYTTIQMMYDLEKKFPGQFKLDIVGIRGSWNGYGNPEYYQNCKDLIEELRLENNVRIFNKIDHDQIPEFLAGKHVIVSNSNEEGTHVAIAEGGCTGCLPFVNAWRGARDVYPDAFRFHSPGDFIALCEDMFTPNGKRLDHISEKISKKFHAKYCDLGKYDRLVKILEKAHKEKVSK